MNASIDPDPITPGLFTRSLSAPNSLEKAESQVFESAVTQNKGFRNGGEQGKSNKRGGGHSALVEYVW